VLFLLTDMPDISLLHRLHKISSEADIEMDYVALGHRNHRDAYETEANRVVSRFKSAKLYDAARAFAKTAHLPADDVTIAQVHLIICRTIEITSYRANGLSG